jgi:hypothetical protein
MQFMKNNKFSLLTLLLIVASFRLTFAQDIKVEASIDSSEFLVGDQVELELKVTQPINEFVGIPVFNEELTKQIEILNQSENDTTLLESGHYIIKKQILITAFDSGYYAVPPIPFLYYSDTLKTEPVLFKVNAIAVDTSQAIKDIKMPYGAPLSFAEVLPWAGGGLGLIVIILVILYIIRKIRRKEPILGRVKPKEPAHIIAYRDLTKLKDNKLWQKDLIKDYYTDLTDILRVYLWNRFAIKTLERTSEEILESLNESDFNDEESFNDLKEIFGIADLVKFAKYKPMVDDHEKCMNYAYNIVDRTKLIVEEKEDNERENEIEKTSAKEEKQIKEQIT